MSQCLSTRRAYTGRVINLDIDRVRFPDGSEGELEIVRHGGASAVLPFVTDPAGPDPEVLLIRQYRYAAEGHLYEVPAGRLDAGEMPEVCAHRELREETGYTATKMRHLTTIYTTPGFTDERIHLFLAEGLIAGDAHRERDEFIEVQVRRLSEAMEMIVRGEIVDGKSLVALLFAVRLR